MKTKNTKLVVKHLGTGKIWKPKERKEVALFVGSSLETVERLLDLFKDEAMVYHIGGEEYVICDGQHREPTLGDVHVN